jgi:hypothetical protein
LSEIKAKKGVCPICRSNINQVTRLYAVWKVDLSKKDLALICKNVWFDLYISDVWACSKNFNYI